MYLKSRTGVPAKHRAVRFPGSSRDSLSHHPLSAMNGLNANDDYTKWRGLRSHAGRNLGGKSVNKSGLTRHGLCLKGHSVGR